MARSTLCSLLFAALFSALLLAGCSSGGGYRTRVLETPETKNGPAWLRPYEVNGQRYTPMQDHSGYYKKGVASWYGKKFHGRKTSNGEIYDMYALSAAHKTLPLGIYAKVTRLDNGRSVVVRVNDRGPFVADRIIDLSYAAAKKLGMVEVGTSRVLVEALGTRQQQQGRVVYQPVKNYDSGRYAVQVGAFSGQENAQRLARQLKAVHGTAQVVQVASGGRALYRVRAGSYQGVAAAEQALEDFVRQGFHGCFVVALDP